MFTALDISTSALVAQRVRLNTIAGNIANLNTQRNENGDMEPYQARYVVFQTDPARQTGDGAAGVRVSEVRTEKIDPIYKYEPASPLAIQEGPRKGYVAYPNINMINEFVDAMNASRAYEANIGVMEVTKNLGAQALRILA